MAVSGDQRERDTLWPLCSCIFPITLSMFTMILHALKVFFFFFFNISILLTWKYERHSPHFCKATYMHTAAIITGALDLREIFMFSKNFHKFFIAQAILFILNESWTSSSTSSNLITMQSSPQSLQSSQSFSKPHSLSFSALATKHTIMFCAFKNSFSTRTFFSSFSALLAWVEIFLIGCEGMLGTWKQLSLNMYL